MHTLHTFSNAVNYYKTISKALPLTVLLVNYYYYFFNDRLLLLLLLQELSYRKQIARQLHTQYIEGIYDNPLTLKYRWRVTQGHWKCNHWVDHTRLTITRVIWHLILSWPWNVSQRSHKVMENGSIWKLGYGSLFGFHSNYGRIFSHFGDIQRQRMIWPWNLSLWSFRVIENGAVR